MQSSPPPSLLSSAHLDPKEVLMAFGMGMLYGGASVSQTYCSYPGFAMIPNSIASFVLGSLHGSIFGYVSVWALSRTGFRAHLQKSYGMGVVGALLGIAPLISLAILNNRIKEDEWEIGLLCVICGTTCGVACTITERLLGQVRQLRPEAPTTTG